MCASLSRDEEDDTLQVDGKLREGSTPERESLHYWAMLARVGLGRFVRQSELARCPHCIVLAFDVTLRSFERLLTEGARADASPQLTCYRNVARHAKAHGLAVFVALTHVDVYEGSRAHQASTQTGTTASTTSSGASSSAAEDEASTCERRVGEKVLTELDAAKRRLSEALGADLVPPERVFAITNYHVSANSRDHAIELAILEFLSQIVDAADKYVQNCAPIQQRPQRCAVA